ncbi:AraC family transcriptional regulator [Lentisphaerota bacterium ZTH]|nr:helix-turn-helix domain-containing protein [Lentisphaerota bacterium]WET06927.1 AraC family transcriptional regulator [Lentisphaerota bacterium ZTH]
MGKFSIILLKTTDEKIDTDSSGELSTNIMYCHKCTHDKGEKLRAAHSHPYWQMEVAIKGSQSIVINKKKYVINQGDAIIIPAFLQHRIYYLTDSENISLKFDVLNYPSANGRCDEPKILKNSHLLEQLNKLLVEVILKREGIHELEQKLLKHVLSCYLSYYQSEDPFKSKSDKFSIEGYSLKEKISMIFEQNDCAKLKVKDLAEKMGYSPNYLSSLFQQLYGESLKQYLNEKVVSSACGFLKYSEMTIIKIAARMKFPDHFSFSHFFKRQTGISPKEYKKQQEALSNEEPKS